MENIKKMSKKRVAVYMRVSTKDQSIGSQLVTIKEYIKDRNFVLYKEYVDHGISGVKERRPEFDQMMLDARKRKFDIVLVYRFDRFSRKVQCLVDACGEFKALGIDFISLSESVDTTTPTGQLVFLIFAGFAEMERKLTIERVKDGLRAAKKKGKEFGRRPGKIKFPDKKTRVLYLKGLGWSVRDISGEVEMPKSTVQAYIKPPLNNYKKVEYI